MRTSAALLLLSCSPAIAWDGAPALPEVRPISSPGRPANVCPETATAYLRDHRETLRFSKHALSDRLGALNGRVCLFRRADLRHYPSLLMIYTRMGESKKYLMGHVIDSLEAGPQGEIMLAAREGIKRRYHYYDLSWIADHAGPPRPGCPPLYIRLPWETDMLEPVAMREGALVWSCNLHVFDWMMRREDPYAEFGGWALYRARVAARLGPGKPVIAGPNVYDGRKVLHVVGRGGLECVAADGWLKCSR